MTISINEVSKPSVRSKVNKLILTKDFDDKTPKKIIKSSDGLTVIAGGQSTTNDYENVIQVILADPRGHIQVDETPIYKVDDILYIIKRLEPYIESQCQLAIKANEFGLKISNYHSIFKDYNDYPSNYYNMLLSLGNPRYHSREVDYKNPHINSRPPGLPGPKPHHRFMDTDHYRIAPKVMTGTLDDNNGLPPGQVTTDVVSTNESLIDNDVVIRDASDHEISKYSLKPLTDGTNPKFFRYEDRYVFVSGSKHSRTNKVVVSVSAINSLYSSEVFIITYDNPNDAIRMINKLFNNKDLLGIEFLKLIKKLGFVSKNNLVVE